MSASCLSYVANCVIFLLEIIKKKVYNENNPAVATSEFALPTLSVGKLTSLLSFGLRG